jgi:hypothetical protein
MKRRILLICLVLLVASPAVLPQGGRRNGPKEFKTDLIGFEEVPAISTQGGGEFRARISRDETAIEFELEYSGLEGNVLQAHIHFGQKGVNGGIVVFLCTNLGNGPAGTQACPAPPARITGTLRAADMVNLAAAQGITAGEFDELVAAIRAGKAYANVHSSIWPGGEIRGQLDRGRGQGDEDDDDDDDDDDDSDDDRVSGHSGHHH